jgi:hypothetical protein
MLKRRLSSLLISLPLLAAASGVMAPQAQAAGAAEEAVRLLSKARAADVKCSYLSVAEKSDLSRFTARAEIAAASQRSASAAKAAAAAGRADASTINCSPELQTDVRETLEAARQAMAAANSPDAGVAASPAPARRKIKPAETEAEPPAPRRTGGAIGTYERVVSAYYLERHCRSLSRSEADRFWKGIVRLHRATVAANGARSVARVMASAERRASGSSCSGSSRAQILAGYREISGR